jgi:pimeloyl-ACP methyl ester carboxylesterase
MTPPPLLLLLTALFASSAAAHGARATTTTSPVVSLAPCKVPGLAEKARCGRLEVFENRAAAAGRKIGIHFVVLKATSTPHATEAIFNFAGGPGDAATRNIGGFAQGLAELRSTRDLVAVDIRGTGSSAPLDCPGLAGDRGVQGFLDEFMPAREVAACRRQLEKNHDLRFYTTPLTMDDVEDVRAALGYDQVDLVGGSYGTRSALVYMRRHPAHVRAALLEGLVPTSDRSPLTFAHDAQASLDKVLAACAADAGCHAAFPDPAGDLRRVLEATARAPAQVALENPSSGQPVTLRLSRDGLAQALRYMLYSPSTHPLVPLYLHEGARGNFKPFAQIAQSFASLFGSGSDGFFLAVTCSEDVRFFTLEEAATAARDTFLGDFRARKQKQACAEWPAGELPAGYAEPVRSSAPTLLISGERDPVTPAAWAAEAARSLPNSVHVVVPGGAHGSDGLAGAECLDRLAVGFLRRGSAAGLDTSCVSKIRTPPFATQLPSEAKVEIPATELAKLAGTYAAAEGPDTMTVRLAGGRLSVEVPGQKPLVLTPVGPLRFKIEGAPPGFFITFLHHEGAAGIAATLEEGIGTKPERFKRQPR